MNERVRTSEDELIRAYGLAPWAEIERRLAELYVSQPLAVATVCDEALDRSGRLLGRVRARARKARA